MNSYGCLSAPGTMLSVENAGLKKTWFLPMTSTKSRTGEERRRPDDFKPKWSKKTMKGKHREKKRDLVCLDAVMWEEDGEGFAGEETFELSTGE